MANDKKLVEQITSMDEDFVQWYTDIVKKADLIDYSSSTPKANCPTPHNWPTVSTDFCLPISPYIIVFLSPMRLMLALMLHLVHTNIM